MQSMCTISVTLQSSSQHQSPSPPKFKRLAWTYLLAQIDFFLTEGILFSVSHADSSIMGASDIGQLSMYVFSVFL